MEDWRPGVHGEEGTGPAGGKADAGLGPWGRYVSSSEEPEGQAMAGAAAGVPPPVLEKGAFATRKPQLSGDDYPAPSSSPSPRPREHWTISGDILGCGNMGAGAKRISWVQAGMRPAVPQQRITGLKAELRQNPRPALSLTLRLWDLSAPPARSPPGTEWMTQRKLGPGCWLTVHTQVRGTRGCHQRPHGRGQEFGLETRARVGAEPHRPPNSWDPRPPTVHPSHFPPRPPFLHLQTRQTDRETAETCSALGPELSRPGKVSGTASQQAPGRPGA